MINSVDRKMKKALIISSILICGIIFLSCSTDIIPKKITIAKIRQSPQNYLGTEIKITGMVTNSIDIPFVSTDFYKINDGTGELWVQTSSGAPNKDSNIKVTGIVVELGAKFEYLQISGIALKQKTFKVL